jgi:hypothetical protein
LSAQDRVLETLPLPYAVAADAVLPRLLDAFTEEVDVQLEDVDRMRLTHWVGFAYRLDDLAKIAELLGIEPLPGEALQSFRARVLALAVARLNGAVSPGEIRGFVYAYLSESERALRSTFVPGLRRFSLDKAFEEQPEHPGFRPLQLVENPLRERRSATLEALRGRVPFLQRWEERNLGLGEAVARIAITGQPKERTAVPVLVNITTGDLIGYAGALRVGQRLALEPADGRKALALLDGEDVTERVFSVGNFVPGVPFTPDDLDEQPLLPRLARGTNRWVFLSVGLYDVRGLNRVFFAIADELLHEGVYDSTFFDHAVFPSGTVARLELEWTEVEPASFQVRVPRCVVLEAPEIAGVPEGPVHEVLADGLRETIAEIRAAGVRAEVLLDPFLETQPQRVRVTLPWIVVPPERAPSGEGETVEFGARFGESALDRARFE